MGIIINTDDLLDAQLKMQESINSFYKEKDLEDYKKQSTGSYLGDWWGNIQAKKDSVAIPTGFPILDDKLDGGLYDGLYVLGAVSSLGKTTFLLQMFDQLAKSGHDVMIFSLEMSIDELIAKSISRITYAIDKECGKTVRQLQDANKHEFFTEKEFEVIERSKERYVGYAQNIYIKEGIGDIGVQKIRESVEKHIEMTGKKPIILIDYLQILAPYSEKMGDKQNTDRNVLELKRISRDFKIPVFVVSSFSRASYNAEVTMASFKESGAIEYSADVLLGLQPLGIGTEGFDMEASKSEANRKIELLILKNRNGRTGTRIDYVFNPAYNFYRETYFDRTYLAKPQKEKKWK